jgi:hypothetical protein
MVNDNLVKSPLCGGFTHIEKPELLAALRNPTIRQQGLFLGTKYGDITSGWSAG